MLGSCDSSSSSSSHKSMSGHPLSDFLDNISSYDGNVMLAAIVSLLLVILFVMLLHIYAQWFLAQARRRRSRNSISVARVFHPARNFHHFHTFTFDDESGNNVASGLSGSCLKGLEASVIASIPLFVYTSSEHKQGLECVVCLSAFEDNEVGRSLSKCGHCFHVECIDMWLQSHSNCPICRAPVVGEKKFGGVVDSVENYNEINSVVGAAGDELLEVVVEGGESRLERINDASNCENCQGEMRLYDSSSSSPPPSSSSSSSSSPSSLGSSLKRMLSWNRSECKVFPSSSPNTNESNA